MSLSFSIFSAKIVQAEKNAKFYLGISEAPPIFKLRSRLKLVQAERELKNSHSTSAR